MQNQRIVYDTLMGAGEYRQRFNCLPAVKILRRFVSMRSSLQGQARESIRETLASAG